VTPREAILIAIDHVQLGMSAGCEDAARAFYVGVLGLHEVPRPRQLVGRGGVWFRGGSVAIHLGVEPAFQPAARAHPAFVVGDLAAMRDGLTAAGLAIEKDESGLPVDRCYIRDPFGNRIELVDVADAGFSLADRSEGQPQD
jgi:catechol 2,3-dioxygenase-like lactoylglutathione lyase family enzyme